MFNDIMNQFKDFFGGTTQTTIELGNSWNDLAVRLFLGIIIGIVISVAYMLSNKKQYSRTFAITLVALPSLVASVIWLVGSDITKAISIGGLFTLIKFRSVPGDAKDILNVLLSMSAGLALGLGCYAVAVMLTIIMVIILVVLNLSKYADGHTVEKQLRITVPENLNFEGVFEEVLSGYAAAYSLDSIKTSHMGTMFELTYTVSMKKDASAKALIDDIRTRNGNLAVVLSNKSTEKAPVAL